MPNRTIVTFRSAAFNTTEEKESFINPGNFGDDLALWMMEALRARGIVVEGEPGQEDFGWFFTFEAGGVEHDFVLGHRDDTEGDWIGWVERRAGLLASLFGGRGRGILPEAVRAIHEALAASDAIRDVRWHTREDMDARNETAARQTPFDP